MDRLQTRAYVFGVGCSKFQEVTRIHYAVLPGQATRVCGLTFLFWFERDRMSTVGVDASRTCTVQYLFILLSQYSLHHSLFSPPTSYLLHLHTT